jgi:hypothetical protein
MMTRRVFFVTNHAAGQISIGSVTLRNICERRGIFMVMLNIDFGWSGRKKNIGKELENVRVIRTFVIRFRQFFNEEFCDKNEGSGVRRGGKFTLFGIFVVLDVERNFVGNGDICNTSKNRVVATVFEKYLQIKIYLSPTTAFADKEMSIVGICY